MLPNFGESATYNAVNFNLTSADPANLTTAGVQIDSLLCPSDTQNQSVAFPATQASSGVTPGWSFNQIYPLPPGKWTQAFTNYAGNAGTFTFGYSNLMPHILLNFYQGVIYNDSSVKIAEITDGTSNTFLFGEHSKGHMYILNPSYAVSDNSWNSGLWRDTLFATLYPVNLAAGNKAAIASSGDIYYSPTAAGATTLAVRTSPSAMGQSTSSRTRSTLGHSIRGMPILRATHARQSDLRDRPAYGPLHQVGQFPGAKPERIADLWRLSGSFNAQRR